MLNRSVMPLRATVGKPLPIASVRIADRSPETEGFGITWRINNSLNDITEDPVYGIFLPESLSFGSPPSIFTPRPGMSSMPLPVDLPFDPSARFAAMFCVGSTVHEDISRRLWVDIEVNLDPDIDLPLGGIVYGGLHQFSLSGKLYRGRALGGLYGGIGRSVLFSGDPAYSSTAVRGLNTVGGWAQLKYQPLSKLEFNGAFGLDNPYATDLRAFPYAQAYGNPGLARNSGSFANVIFRPRSDLLFSAEYRHLKTYMINSGPNGADHVNLMMGVLF